MYFDARTSVPSPATLQLLRDLIDLSLTSRQAFDFAAQEVEDLVVSNLFQKIAQDHADQAAELQTLIASSDESQHSPSTSPRWGHPAFGDDFQQPLDQLLEQAERTVANLKVVYEQSLQDTLDPPYSDVLSRHYAALKEDEARLAALRTHLNESAHPRPRF